MRRSPFIVGAIASSLLAANAPAQSEVASASQTVRAATGSGPISPAAHDQILNLSQLRLAQGYKAFSEMQPGDRSHPDPDHFKQHANVRSLKRHKQRGEHNAAVKDVAAVYLLCSSDKHS